MSQAAARRVPQPRRTVNLTLERAAVSFERHLRAENKSPATVTTYLLAVEQFRAFLSGQGGSDELRRVTRDDIEAFLVALEDGGAKPATRAQRFRSLQQFFRWAVEAGELRESPMARLRPPAIPDAPPPILREEQPDRVLRRRHDARRLHGPRPAAAR